MNVRRWQGGHDDREEDEAKMGFIFQINEHGFGTQLHEEKGQNKGPNHIDYLPSPYPHYLYRTSPNTPLIFNWLHLNRM